MDAQQLTPEQKEKLEALLREVYAQGYSDGFNAGNTPRIEPDFTKVIDSALPLW